MDKSQAKLSPLEWEIMEVIWQESGRKISVRDVINIAYPNAEKAYTTVQTVMNNLEAKRFLSKQKIGLVNFYTVQEKRHTLLKKETSRFVEKVFGGSFHSLANYLIDSSPLSTEEIADLKKMIEQRESRSK